METTRRRSSKNLALRALHREKIRKETGSLMHSKQDLKSDLLCCVKSEGLCRAIGAKHHRRNKNCWSFPDLCMHCKKARAISGPDNPRLMLMSPRADPELKQPSPQHMVTPKLHIQLINESRVDANSKPCTVNRLQTARSAVDNASEHVLGTIGEPSVNRSRAPIDRRYRSRRGSSEHVACTIESDEEASHGDNYMPSTPDFSTINDLEKRHIRSAAPSPECAEQRAVRAARLLLDPKQKDAARDQRLDLNFVLGSGS